jgi:MFS family permease
LNGIGLAIVIPAIQSVVADSTSNVNRGTAFGWLQMAGNIGSVVGGLCGVLLSGEVLFGLAGWRVAFFLVGFLSILVGILVYLFAVDPRNTQHHNV